MIINESQCNVKEEDDAQESVTERKTRTNILPTMLKSNKMNVVRSFSERVLNGSLKLDVGDVRGVAN